MTEPLISVIMPAYNAQKYIAESIDSVIEQTWQNWELIITDDGSTDETASVIKAYQKKNPRINYHYQSNNGPGIAKNTAIDKSKGRYIAFLDADDIWLKEKLQLSYNAIFEYDCDLIFTNCYIFHKEKEISKLHHIAIDEQTYSGIPGINLFLERNRIPNLTVLAKRDAVLATGGFSTIPLAEDYELWLKMLANGYIFKSLATPLSLYRLHDESITSTDRHAYLEVIEVLKSFGRQHPQYAATANRIAAKKIKHWLYNGRNRSAKKYRELIAGVYKQPFAALFGGLSLFIPLKVLKKVVARIY